MNMRRVLTALTLLICVAAPASAGVLGDTIHGHLEFPTLLPGTNLFDPAAGFVPAGSSGIQPSAVVQDPNPGYQELMMYISSSQAGVNVDVTDNLLSATWASDGFNAILWDPTTLTISDLDWEGMGDIEASIVLQNTPDATVTVGSHEITIDTPAGMTTFLSTHTVLIELRTTSPVSVEPESWGGIKELYR